MAKTSNRLVPIIIRSSAGRSDRKVNNKKKRTQETSQSWTICGSCLEDSPLFTQTACVLGRRGEFINKKKRGREKIVEK